jgi:uncharacterized membrane protein
MIRKEIRQQKIKLRKNFLPILVVIFVLWGLLGLMLVFSDPEASGVLLLFFGLFFLATLFSLATLLSNTRRGVIAACALTFFLALRYFGVGSILNFSLIVGIAVACEIYFLKR